jgi:hypothetical protein
MKINEAYAIPSDDNEFVICEIVYTNKQKTVPLSLNIKYTKSSTKTHLHGISVNDFQVAVQSRCFIKIA